MLRYPLLFFLCGLIKWASCQVCRVIRELSNHCICTACQRHLMRVLCEPSEWRFNVRFTLCQLVTSNEAIGGFACEWIWTPGTAGPFSSGLSYSFGLAQNHSLCCLGRVCLVFWEVGGITKICIWQKTACILYPFYFTLIEMLFFKSQDLK